MKELMKSIESAIVAAASCVEGAHYDCTTEEEAFQNLTHAEDMLQEALCNFAQLCNAIEGKPGRKINLEEAIRRAEGLE